MDLLLFDTYSRSLRPFAPLEPGPVRLYACGPTVYAYAHLGNLRTYLFEDVLRRVLERAGYEVRHVVNITDVGHLTSDADEGEDKMEQSAVLAGESVWELARRFTLAFKEDLAALNVLPPSIWCRATDHIQEQIDFIGELVAGGFTYITGDGVYFDSTRLSSYGWLARLDAAGLRSGARVAQGEKRSVTDFALWKFSPPDRQRQMEWDSPWGRGFPGWHIECSAMAAKYLGDFFDIHCGGQDHISVHHTNEIAQTEASRGTRLANFWMHGYFLQLEDDRKMSKSGGPLLRLRDLTDAGIDPLAYRYFCMTAHYRSNLKFSRDGLQSAVTALGRLYNHAWQLGEAGDAVPDARFVQLFDECLGNDLNTAKGLALAWELLQSDLPGPVKKATLLNFDQVFGLEIAAFKPEETSVPDAVAELALAREAARREKRWADADRLREEIRLAGFEVEDTPEGPRFLAAEGGQEV